MKYFLSVNYLEDKLHQKILGINIPTLLSEKKQQLQLISIGIVSEDHTCECCKEGGTHLSQYKTGMYCDKTNLSINGKEYYAICKDFDIEVAWNSYQLKTEEYTRLIDGDMSQPVLEYKEETDDVIQWKKDHPGFKTETVYGETYKEYWLRENVLLPIIIELLHTTDKPSWYCKNGILLTNDYTTIGFTYRLTKKLINKYGKTRKQIVEEIKEFIYVDTKCTKRTTCDKNGVETTDYFGSTNTPEFYAYGNINNLPKGFPMYCKDLKQKLDDKWNYELYKFILSL